MPEEGAYKIRLEVAGRLVNLNVIVVSRLSDDIILGMNTISDIGLACDPLTLTFSYNKRLAKRQSWSKADIYPVRACEITPGDSRFIKCRARKPTGEDVVGQQEIIVDIAGVSSIVKTNECGVFLALIPNLSPMRTLELQRDRRVGEAYHRDEFITAGLDQKGVEILECGIVHGYVDKISATMVSDNTAGQVTEVAQIIEETVRKLPEKKHQNRLRNILVKYQECISRSKTDLGRIKQTGMTTDETEHTIDLEDCDPVFRKQFPLTGDELQLIKANLYEWLKQDVVERAKSPYNAPIFTVKKKEGHGYRIVLDYRGLNNKTLKDRYSLKGVEECIAQVGRMNSKVFSVIDLTSAFWQVPLKKEHRRFTAFTIPGVGQFQWRCTPMGLTGAPATFARLIDHLMGGLDNIITYIDDVLCHSRTIEEHFDHLEEAFKRICAAGLKINLSKCEFAVNTVQYLGHTLTDKGIKPGLDKTKAIREADMPRDLKTLRAFLGLVNYFRAYIQHFSQKAAPLYNLTKNTSAWQKGVMPPEAVEAFKKLRKELTSEPLLAYPLAKGFFHLFVDSATGTNKEDDGGLGACIAQERPDGSIRPIAYANRRLKKHEKNYSAFLLEMAAAIYGMDCFRHYLRGRPFHLYTDHKPLEKLSVAHTKTLSRFQEYAQEFSFQTHYIKGAVTPADFLSRTSLTAVSPIKPLGSPLMEELYEEDEETAVLLRYLQQRSKPEDAYQNLAKYATWQNGMIELRLPERRRGFDFHTVKFLAPVRLRARLLKEAHNSRVGGHAGQYKTYERIRDQWYWPNMDKDIAEHIKFCTVCQRNANNQKDQPLPLKQLPAPRAPNDRLHVDLFGPLSDQYSDNKRIVVITDAFTKFVVLAVIPEKSAPEVAQAIMNKWVSLFGVPREVVSDQGLEFRNALMSALWKKLGTSHTVTSPYHPQTNGQVEVFNKTMAHYLRTVIDECEDSNLNWELYLGALQLSHNTAVSRATRTTPFYTLFGYDPRMPLWKEGEVLGFGDVAQKSDRELMQDPTTVLRAAQEKTRSTAFRNNMLDRDIQARAYQQQNPRACLREFAKDDLVWARIQQTQGRNKKLQPLWEPAVILEPPSTHTAKVRRLKRKNRPVVTLNLSQLKLRLEPRDEKVSEEELQELEAEDIDGETQSDGEEASDTESEAEEDTEGCEDTRPEPPRQTDQRRGPGRPRGSKTRAPQVPEVGPSNPDYQGPRTRAAARAEPVAVWSIIDELDHLERNYALEEAYRRAEGMSYYIQEAMIRRILHRGWRGSQCLFSTSGPAPAVPAAAPTRTGPTQEERVGQGAPPTRAQGARPKTGARAAEPATGAPAGTNEAARPEGSAQFYMETNGNTFTRGTTAGGKVSADNPFARLRSSVFKHFSPTANDRKASKKAAAKEASLRRLEANLASHNAPGLKETDQDLTGSTRNSRASRRTEVRTVATRQLETRPVYFRPPGRPSPMDATTWEDYTAAMGIIGLD